MIRVDTTQFAKRLYVNHVRFRLVSDNVRKIILGSMSACYKGMSSNKFTCFIVGMLINTHVSILCHFCSAIFVLGSLEVKWR